VGWGLLRGVKTTITELLFHVPSLREQQDVEAIGELLANAPGIGLVLPNYLTQQLRVTTSNSDMGMDVVRRLSAGGFSADEFHRAPAVTVPLAVAAAELPVVQP